MQAPRLPLPHFVQIEPVGQCNLRCQMCPIQFRRDGPPYGPPAFMPYVRFCALIDGFPDMTELHLQGLGEPMMHPRFFDMIGYAAGKGIKVSINTNLTLLSTAGAARCVSSGLDGICVSIDGATAATYNRIRVGADFDSVVAHIQMLVSARRASRNTKPWIRLVMVLMRQNLHELPDLVEHARAWDIDEMSVQHLCHDFAEETLPAHYAPMRAFVDEQMLGPADDERVQAVFAEANARATRLSLPLRLPKITPTVHAPGTPGPKRCDWPWRGAYISYDSQAMPCCMVATPDRANFGTIKDDANAVWNNSAYHEFRSKLASDDPPNICRTCSVYRGTF